MCPNSCVLDQIFSVFHIFTLFFFSFPEALLPVVLVVAHLGVHVKFNTRDSLQTRIDLMLAEYEGGVSVTDALGNRKMNLSSVDMLHHM